jgi:mono/diheme cytochrome c family protein
LKIRDGQMFHILTYGQNNMPSYAAQIDRQDRWKVIAYVRTLQAAAKPKGTSL